MLSCLSAGLDVQSRDTEICSQLADSELARGAHVKQLNGAELAAEASDCPMNVNICQVPISKEGRHGWTDAHVQFEFTAGNDLFPMLAICGLRKATSASVQSCYCQHTLIILAMLLTDKGRAYRFFFGVQDCDLSRPSKLFSTLALIIAGHCV